MFHVYGRGRVLDFVLEEALPQVPIKVSCQHAGRLSSSLLFFMQMQLKGDEYE